MASEATEILWAINAGNSGGTGRLLELVYDELRAVAHRAMRPKVAAEPLQPTELVHEAYLRLVDKQASDWRSRSHFFAVAATAMRHILVDAARARAQLKRGGGAPHFSLDEGLVLSTDRDADVLALDDALLVLADESGDRARLVELRFFGGLTMDEIATATDTSKRSVEREWRITRAWLRRHLAR
jgi:RNA polymerase sigma factor (TIGR02999 family)